MNHVIVQIFLGAAVLTIGFLVFLTVVIRKEERNADQGGTAGTVGS